MTLDPWVLAAILAMALVTYATRAGGYVLFRVAKPPQIVRDMLAYVPGALFISYVVPTLAAGGAKQWVGAAATLFVIVVARSLTLAILCGTGAAWLIYLWR